MVSIAATILLAVIDARAETHRSVSMAEVLGRADILVRVEFLRQEERTTTDASYSTIRFVFQKHSPALLGVMPNSEFAIQYEIYRYARMPMTFEPGREYILALDKDLAIASPWNTLMPTYRLAAGKSAIFAVRAQAGRELISSDDVRLGIETGSKVGTIDTIAAESATEHSVEYEQFLALVAASTGGISR